MLSRSWCLFAVFGLGCAASAQTLIWSRNAHSDEINDIAFSSAGYIATACEDGSVKLWYGRNGAPVSSLISHWDPAKCLAFTRDGQYFASGGIDRGINVYRTSDYQRLYRIDTTGFIEGLAFTANSQTLEASLGYSSNDLRDFRTSDGEHTSITHHHWGTVWSVDCSANGQYVATSGADGRVIVYSGPYHSYIFDVDGHENDVIAVRFSPTSSVLASAGSYDGKLILTSMPSGNTIRAIDVGFVIYDIAFSWDGTRIAVAGEEIFSDGTVKVYSVATGALLE